MKILLVEDEDHIAQGLVFNFKLEGYDTEVTATGEAALLLFEQQCFDLIVLDVMLPGIDGFEVARRIRQVDRDIPVLMLTAMASDEDKIAGLEIGVDDYLTKPFVLKELLLRMASLLRRSARHKLGLPLPEDPFQFGQALVDPAALTATTEQKIHSLTRIEIDLMRFFAARPEKLVTRKELLAEVWGLEPNTATRTVDTFILRIRKIIEPNPKEPIYLTSIRGEGYRLNLTPRRTIEKSRP